MPSLKYENIFLRILKLAANFVEHLDM